ncbi:class II aldolase/adducin family protein [Colwellia sp. MB3u-70]|uniref:class II aldolase/adducin family protein n=1 Tax=unclassified Colwellia TaxID=196834 RepID=UPI0015F4961F|nr:MULTISPECIES: class II aldolase/adducin family protein [unclassified Colwellia]MBA6293534.1 class II aldolase/adducin family protein [Colwellia sp. MB3u-8]MBA6306066.1 class II aldolase/adducin family protein [Colwellia sp. MB3u-70]
MQTEQELRVDLAAAFRLIYEMDMHESVANHLSAAVSTDGKQFLMNPRWMHFSNVTASNLQLLDSEDDSIMQTDQAPDASAWTIHGNMHASLPTARVILHLHSTYATVLSTLKDPRILPIDNNTARFFERIAYDKSFGGIATSDAEGKRIVDSLAGKNALMMGNHGITVTGATIAEAFEDLYYLEKACKTMVLAYSTGQPLNILSDELARQTAESWDEFRGQSYAHFEQQKAMLDKKGSSYRE